MNRVNSSRLLRLWCSKPAIYSLDYCKCIYANTSAHFTTTYFTTTRDFFAPSLPPVFSVPPWLGDTFPPGPPSDVGWGGGGGVALPWPGVPSGAPSLAAALLLLGRRCPFCPAAPVGLACPPPDREAGRGAKGSDLSGPPAPLLAPPPPGLLGLWVCLTW